MKILFWRLFYALFIVLVFTGCQTVISGRPVDDAFRDAALIADQERTIAELRDSLERMGSVVTELHTGIGSVTDGLAGSIERIERSIERGAGLTDLFAEIDLFVRNVIAENERLRDLQFTTGAAYQGVARAVGRNVHGERKAEDTP